MQTAGRLWCPVFVLLPPSSRLQRCGIGQSWLCRSQASCGMVTVPSCTRKIAGSRQHPHNVSVALRVSQADSWAGAFQFLFAGCFTVSTLVRKSSAGKAEHSAESLFPLHALPSTIGQQLSEEVLPRGDGILCYKHILTVGPCGFA